MLEADRLEIGHDIGRLNGMRTRADPQVNIRLGHSQFLEEHGRHLLVVVLPGVHKQLGKPTPPGFQDYRGHLHEIGPCSYYRADHRCKFVSRYSMKQLAILARLKYCCAARRPFAPSSWRSSGCP